ncbi:MAG TPA: aromatic ring-hydroxylating dioxygenase subunit alpha [Ilumatobacteraceae bacterium]|nr:aromatic ring-hydroxylating dioxygenase subunit alpha [Ilumatobacteraceae bacterium]
MELRTDSFCANPTLRTQWYVVAGVGDIADAPVRVTLLGERYVLWRPPGGAVSAAHDRCPHREAPLSEGTVSNGCLVCPYHAWAFDGEGVCVDVPSSGPGASIPSAAHLHLVAVSERYGLVWLCPGMAESGPPEIPQDRDPSYRRVTAAVETWRVSATRMADNFCDVAHFPYVHAGTIGPDTDPIVAPIHVEALDADFTGYRYTADLQDEHGNEVRQRMSTAFHLPFVVRSNTSYESGPRTGHDRVLLLCTTPIDDVTSLFAFVSWRNHDHDLSTEEFIAFDRAIGAEDRAMLERIDGVLPLDQSATVSVRADRLSVEWRRRLADLLDGTEHRTSERSSR